MTTLTGLHCHDCGIPLGFTGAIPSEPGVRFATPGFVVKRLWRKTYEESRLQQFLLTRGREERVSYYDSSIPRAQTAHDLIGFAVMYADKSKRKSLAFISGLLCFNTESFYRAVATASGYELTLEMTFRALTTTHTRNDDAEST